MDDRLSDRLEAHAFGGEATRSAYSGLRSMRGANDGAPDGDRLRLHAHVIQDLPDQLEATPWLRNSGNTEVASSRMRSSPTGLYVRPPISRSPTIAE